MFLKIEDFMLPCLNKQLFGIDCLGCGLQRSLVLLFQGNFKAAFFMYPAIYTLLFFAFYILLNRFYKFNKNNRNLTILITINLFIIITGYFYKMKIFFN